MNRYHSPISTSSPEVLSQNGGRADLHNTQSGVPRPVTQANHGGVEITRSLGIECDVEMW